MKARQVRYEEQASLDLLAVFDWLSETASPLSAIRIVNDLATFIEGLDLAAERGTLRDDLRPKLRVLGHGRAVVAISVDEDAVYVLRIFYGGQDWEAAPRDGP